MNEHLNGTDVSVTQAGEKTVEQVSKAQTVNAMIDRLQDSDDSNNPHAFVIMPFGQKSAADGRMIDFDKIYEDLIKPALIEGDSSHFVLMKRLSAETF